MNIQNENAYTRILNAATKLFAEKGYSATTTREIVKEAESSLSTLQTYFQSKENVYFEAINQALNRQHDLLKPVLDEIDEVERQGLMTSDIAWNLIVDLVGKLTDWVFLKEEHHVIRLMNQEMTNPSPMFEKVPPLAMYLHCYFQKLFCVYTGNQDPFWTKLLSFSIVVSFLNYANYSHVLEQILECDTQQPENILRIKISIKSYLLTSIRAYLDSYKTGEPV